MKKLNGTMTMIKPRNSHVKKSLSIKESSERGFKRR